MYNLHLFARIAVSIYSLLITKDTNVYNRYISRGSWAVSLWQHFFFPYTSIWFTFSLNDKSVYRYIVQEDIQNLFSHAELSSTCENNKFKCFYTYISPVKNFDSSSLYKIWLYADNNKPFLKPFHEYYY